VVRAIYWGREPTDLSPIRISKPIQLSLYGCMASMFLLGIYPNLVLSWALEAAKVLR
jgi:NADH:ubiquinone oxidoreductase subunit 2 (subunit N)